MYYKNSKKFMLSNITFKHACCLYKYTHMSDIFSLHMNMSTQEIHHTEWNWHIDA